MILKVLEIGMLELFLLLCADDIIYFNIMIFFRVCIWFAKGIRYFKRLLLQMEACS